MRGNVGQTVAFLGSVRLAQSGTLLSYLLFAQLRNRARSKMRREARRQGAAWLRGCYTEALQEAGIIRRGLDLRLRVRRGARHQAFLQRV